MGRPNHGGSRSESALLSPYEFIGWMGDASGHGQLSGHPVYGAGRREDDPPHAGAGHRPEHAEGAADVVVEVGAGIGDQILDRF